MMGTSGKERSVVSALVISASSLLSGTAMLTSFSRGCSTGVYGRQGLGVWCHLLGLLVRSLKNQVSPGCRPVHSLVGCNGQEAGSQITVDCEVAAVC